MTYDPRAYWAKRPVAQGAAYVGPGGRIKETAEQARAIEDILERLLGDHRTEVLLDFGCGSGRLSRALAARAVRYIGVDISQTGLALAPILTNGRYIWLEHDRIPLRDATVSLVVAITVIQHIPAPDWKVWSAEIRRVLAPDGQALVIDSMPLEAPGEHMHPRTPAEIADALKLPEVTSLTRHAGHWSALLCS